MVFFCVIARFVDIEEIIGHSLQFLFIITSHLKSLNIYKKIIEHTYSCFVSYNMEYSSDLDTYIL